MIPQEIGRLIAHKLGSGSLSFERLEEEIAWWISKAQKDAYRDAESLEQMSLHEFNSEIDHIPIQSRAWIRYGLHLMGEAIRKRAG